MKKIKPIKLLTKYKNTIYNFIRKLCLNNFIAIKIPVPNWENAHEWGDYHFALALKKELKKLGYNTLLQILPEWDNGEDLTCKVVIVLRGLSKYEPKKNHFNIMWNISHPDKVTIEEYNKYDYVLIASEIWYGKIKPLVTVPVEAMLQCTDINLFYPEYSKKYKNDLLFVGNSRKIFRKIIKDLLPTDKNLAVYGTNWEQIIDKKYLKGKHIQNNELRKAYSSCKILLNDHWDDMRNKGFISNRLFDGFASGAFIITDRISGAENIFGNALVSYDTPEELNDLIDKYIDNEKIRKDKAEEGRLRIMDKHTFKNRAERIIEIINLKYKSH